MFLLLFENRVRQCALYTAAKEHLCGAFRDDPEWLFHSQPIRTCSPLIKCRRPHRCIRSQLHVAGMLLACYLHAYLKSGCEWQTHCSVAKRWPELFDTAAARRTCATISVHGVKYGLPMSAAAAAKACT